MLNDDLSIDLKLLGEFVFIKVAYFRCFFQYSYA